jgi:hypothetical protein
MDAPTWPMKMNEVPMMRVLGVAQTEFGLQAFIVMEVWNSFFFSFMHAWSV